MQSLNFPPILGKDLPAYRARPQIIVITTECVWSVRVRIGTPICYICSALFNCVPDVISVSFRLQEIQWIIFHTHAHCYCLGAGQICPATLQDTCGTWIRSSWAGSTNTRPCTIRKILISRESRHRFSVMLRMSALIRRKHVSLMIQMIVKFKLALSKAKWNWTKLDTWLQQVMSTYWAGVGSSCAGITSWKGAVSITHKRPETYLLIANPKQGNVTSYSQMI